MRICIAYESVYGNGKKCVDYLEKLLRAKGNNTQTLSIRNVKPDSLPSADLYIFSSIKGENKYIKPAKAAEIVKVNTKLLFNNNLTFPSAWEMKMGMNLIRPRSKPVKHKKLNTCIVTKHSKYFPKSSAPRILANRTLELKSRTWDPIFPKNTIFDCFEILFRIPVNFPPFASFFLYVVYPV